MMHPLVLRPWKNCQILKRSLNFKKKFLFFQYSTQPWCKQTFWNKIWCFILKLRLNLYYFLKFSDLIYFWVNFEHCQNETDKYHIKKLFNCTDISCYTKKGSGKKSILMYLVKRTYLLFTYLVFRKYDPLLDTLDYSDI